jgi:hypothetical protein
MSQVKGVAQAAPNVIIQNAMGRSDNALAIATNGTTKASGARLCLAAWVVVLAV